MRHTQRLSLSSKSLGQSILAADEQVNTAKSLNPTADIKGFIARLHVNFDISIIFIYLFFYALF